MELVRKEREREQRRKTSEFFNGFGSYSFVMMALII
jgi:hypothetical protein